MFYEFLRQILIFGQKISQFETNLDNFDGELGDDAYRFELSDNDIARLKELERGFRVVELAANQDHKYYPFRDNYSE